MAGVDDVLIAVQRTVDEIPSIVASHKDIPGAAPTDADLPAAISRLDRDRQGSITLGMEQWRTYPIRVDVLVKRKVSDQIDQAALYGFVELVADIFSANISVQGVGAVQPVIEWRIGLLAIWEVTYWAASLFLAVEEHVERIPTE
ncbi:MAG: hypothetical protein ACRDJ9_23210 [Dehalococcoidia bacterium]